MGGFAIVGKTIIISCQMELLHTKINFIVIAVQCQQYRHLYENINQIKGVSQITKIFVILFYGTQYWNLRA